MRRERSLLQHEVDILNQKFTQELLTLKDDLKGMFNDRKMDVRMEQRSMESAVSICLDHLFYNSDISADPRTQLQNYSSFEQ